MAKKLEVFFDGDCPVCSREIAFYRARESVSAIDWVDVCKADPQALPQDASREQLLGRFHVRDGDGELVSGAAAFAALWRTMPSMRWLGRLISAPLVAPLAEMAYALFLRVRPLLPRRQA